MSYSITPSLLLKKPDCWEWLAGFMCATAVVERARGLPPTLSRPDSPIIERGLIYETLKSNFSNAYGLAVLP